LKKELLKKSANQSTCAPKRRKNENGDVNSRESGNKQKSNKKKA
jgi:hypothetical protein